MSDRGLHTTPPCHVYLVTAKAIPDDMPRGDCFACGQPLRGHEKRVSKLVPDDDRAFVIDEKVLGSW